MAQTPALHAPIIHVIHIEKDDQNTMNALSAPQPTQLRRAASLDPCVRMIRLRTLLLLAVCLLGACAHRPSHDPADPLEPLNRGIYAFNSTADRYVVRPVAKGYRKTVPGFARTGINNFFSNLTYPITILNQFLQGKPARGSRDFGRFLINTSIGLGGLIDVASYWGLAEHNEDFGQTFGRWGIGEGWYLMLPFLGPTTNRDLLGRLAAIPLSPTYDLDNPPLGWSLSLLDAIQFRAQLLNADALLQGQLDPYAFVRSSYLQSRWSAQHDGRPPLEEPEFEFDDF